MSPVRFDPARLPFRSAVPTSLPPQQNQEEQPVQALLTPFSYVRQPDRAEIRTKDSTEELRGGKPEQLGQFYPSWETGQAPKEGGRNSLGKTVTPSSFIIDHHVFLGCDHSPKDIANNDQCIQQLCA